MIQMKANQNVLPVRKHIGNLTRLSNNTRTDRMIRVKIIMTKTDIYGFTVIPKIRKRNG